MVDLLLRRRIEDDVRHVYGNLMEPIYSWVQPKYESSPYETVIRSLQVAEADVVEQTDLNEDVSVLLIAKHSAAALVIQLSLVGPYALVRPLSGNDAGAPLTIAPPGAPAFVAVALERLEQGGFTILDRETVLSPIRMMLFNTPLEEATLYQALFSDEPPEFECRTTHP